MESKVWVFTVLLVAFMAIGAYVFVNSDVGTGQTVSVSGISEITSKPDFVSVIISVETLDMSAEESKNENSEISEDVISSLKDLGFSEDEIETLSWNLYEEYEYTQSGRNFKGYKTTNQIKVKFEDYDLAGKVVDAAVDNGALISYINFELSQETSNELKAQALEEATKDAKNKAEALARGSDKKIGRLVSISSSDYYYNPIPYYAFAEGDSATSAREAATQISPRELTVTANVQAVYSLRG